MKKNFIYRLFVLLALMSAATVACQKEEPDVVEDVEKEEEVEEEVPGPSEETPSSEGITNVKNSYTTSEFCKTFLEFFAVVVACCLLDLSFDLCHT